MALWGRDDNLASPGTVTLTATAEASGAYKGLYKVTAVGATPFTLRTSSIATGDEGRVIRFGTRGDGDAATFFGDAVIAKVETTAICYIDSTEGLTGEAITEKDYYLSELPSYTVGDHQWSNKHDTKATYKTVANPTNLGTAGIGNTNIAFRYKDVDPALAVGGVGQDSILIGGSNIEFASLGSATTKTTSASPVGFSTIFINKAALPNISNNSAEVVVTVGGVSGKHVIVSSGTTYVAIGGTISAQVTKGADVTVHSPHLVGLASTIPSALADGDTLTVQRKSGGYDRIIYGVSVQDAQAYGDSSGKYRTSGSGWVGVTTYIDCDNNLRVKSEILVAMGPNKDNGNTGITTGSNGIAYPTDQ